MNQDAWVFDDGSVPDDAHVFRRLPNKPPFVVVPDALGGGAKEVGIAVYSYDNDGMSVHSSSAMADEGITHADLIDWDTTNLCVVSVTVVRRSLPAESASPGSVSPGETHEVAGGVVADEVEHPTDERVGRAHALVRIQLAPDTKKTLLKPAWNAFRQKLLNGTHFKVDREGEWVPQPAWSPEGPAAAS